MSQDIHANFVFAQVTVAPSPATSGITIGISNAQAALFPDPASGAYNPTVWPANQMPLSTNSEVLRFTAKGAADSAGTGNTQFTIARLQEQNAGGTMTARSIQVGDWIALNITKKWFTDIETGKVDRAGDTMTGALILALATGNSFIVDTSTLVVDATNHRVGMGTATPANPLHLLKSNLASAAAALFDITQTSVNTTDTGDSAFNLKYNLILSSASNELVARIFKLDFTNTLTGGGAITNARIFNLATNTATGTTITNLDAILIETGTTNGTVTTVIGLHIATLQGTTKWGIKDDSGGNWTLTGQIQASPGGASAPGYGFFGGTGEGMYRDTTPALLWAIGGTQKMKLTSTGLGVGAGVTPNSALQTGGAIATPLGAKTGAYTLTATDAIITADATGGAFNVTLPTAASITGRQYTIKRINTGANAVTVNTTSSQTIDGATTYSLSAQYKYVSVVSDGANWLIVANN